MTHFALAALLTATLAGLPVSVAAQEYGRPDYRPDYQNVDPRDLNQPYDGDIRYDNRGQQIDRRGYDEQRYYDDRGDNRGYDNRAYDNRGYDNRRYDTRGRGFVQRGEGWIVLRQAAGPAATRDPRFVRWALQNFDRNRDGILTRQEGYRARATLVRSRSNYAQGW